MNKTKLGWTAAHLGSPRQVALQLRFHFSMEKWWKNKGKVSGPWKNKALFLPFSRIWKQRSFFLCSSTVFPWKKRNSVAVWDMVDMPTARLAWQ